jgi:hypothetical protein
MINLCHVLLDGRRKIDLDKGWTGCGASLAVFPLRLSRKRR